MENPPLFLGMLMLSTEGFSSSTEDEQISVSELTGDVGVSSSTSISSAVSSSTPGTHVSVTLPSVPTEWVRMCRRRSQLRRKTFLQQVHSYGFRSVWVSKCVFRLERWLKLRAHTGHLCGDSSRWRIRWTASVRDWQNPLPQSPHLNGFSFEWM